MVMAVQFDTLRYVEKLRSGGVPEGQAKAGAEALAMALGEWVSTSLATKADFHEIKGEIADIKVETAQIKGDLRGFRTESKGDLAALDARLSGEITLLKWMLVTVLAGVGSLVSKAFF